MDCPFPERRRSPRVATASGTLAIRPVSMNVRLLDLSSDGLMLASPRPLPIAATARVVSWLAGRRLEVDVVVRHVSRQWVDEAGGYLVGGRFPSLEPPARLTVERLLASVQPLGAGARAGPGVPAPRTRHRRPRPRTRSRPQRDRLTA